MARRPVTIVFLAVTAAALGVEVWGAWFGGPVTWTDLIVQYIPEPVTTAAIAVLVAWLPVHFARRYHRRLTMDEQRTADGTRVADIAASLIRTLTPTLVVSVGEWLTMHYHTAVPPKVSAMSAVWVTGGLVAAYYGAARWLEHRTGDRWRSRAGRWLGRWMLGGVVGRPTYPRDSDQPPATPRTLSGPRAGY
jgi:hypothetical protein